MLGWISLVALTGVAASAATNPNPTFYKDVVPVVRFGDQTWDEMMIGWFEVTIPATADPKNLFRVRQATGDK